MDGLSEYNLYKYFGPLNENTGEFGNPLTF